MLLNLDDVARAVKGLSLTSAIHCGARLGEEASAYARLGITHVTWVEANGDVIERLRRAVFPSHQVIHACLDESEGWADFNVSNLDGLSSSLLKFGTHRSFSPEIEFVRTDRVQTVTLDSLGLAADLLVMDLQGAELRCLRGGVRTLAAARCVYTEVNTAEVYLGCAKLDEMDAFLSAFDRVATELVRDQGWGDALYVRRA